MHLVPVLVLTLTALLPAAPATAGEHGSSSQGPATVTEIRTAGTAWGVDPATGRTTLTVDESVDNAQARVLRVVAERSGAVFRREPGRLRLLIAGGQAIYGGAGRCSLGANVRASGTYYFVTAGHCTRAASTWYADSSRTIPLGPNTGSSFPGNDYGIVRYTGTISHPSAVYTYPQLLPITGAGNAYVGQAVCRSGATTGVRCGTVTGLNQTVNYAEGTVFGLIRTNICAEPGDSGGPLYSASTGTILGILSGGSGNCTTGGTTYYQPIMEILAAYGVTIP
ncbi:S1 family peptidase [Plantactinospora sp. KLBMP9567]|uniref:S1 family peptidase n=1 Tax=Plantactinospora sp. KLBMP9567 TaxID=3085900 RepID=UPI0029812300|nr:S1 family peptidase [Plantactinospora sp. KLBMP9567]MDW5322419.1 S1 family peptidase [Plantactinospora sp. KLBMP9567]